MHIFDPRFAPSPHWKRTPPNASVAAYRKLQQRLGTSRTVIVNPSTYGIDNACTLDALREMGSAARAVAVVDVDVSDAELKRMDALGVVGIRVNFVSPQIVGHDDTDDAANAVAAASRRSDGMFRSSCTARRSSSARGAGALPVTLVIDHLGRVPQPAGVAIRRMRRSCDCSNQDGRGSSCPVRTWTR
jgi:predicted TIM-barrel fold metal-dependent hydrolase